MQHLNVDAKSKFYTMRKANVQLTFENKVLVGIYLVNNLHHLHGVAFAFQMSPISLLYRISGMFCFHSLQNNITIPCIMDIEPRDLILHDISYIIYQSLLHNELRVIQHLESLYKKDIYALGGTKLCRYLLNDLDSPQSLISTVLQKNNHLSIDDCFIGLVVALKEDYSSDHMTSVLIKLLPQLSLIKELHLFILNTILDLVPNTPHNLTHLISLFVDLIELDECQMIRLSAYCWYYTLYTSPVSTPVVKHPFQHFKQDAIVNQYILYLTAHELNTPSTSASSIIQFIMTLDHWPLYYKSLLINIGYVLASTQSVIEDDLVTTTTTNDDRDDMLLLLQNCASWLIHHNDPLRHGYLIQSTIKILSDYSNTLAIPDLLKPYCHTNFISHKSLVIHHNLTKLINIITNEMQPWYKQLLHLYVQWIDVLDVPFYQLLNVVLVLYYMPKTMITCPSIPSDLFDVIPDHVLINVYFKCKYKYTPSMSHLSFYEYFTDLSIYLQLFKYSNIYEALFIKEQLYFTNKDDADWDWFMQHHDDDLVDFKNGLFHCQNKLYLQEWEPVNSASTPLMQYNQCVCDLNKLDYPLDVYTLKHLSHKNDDLYNSAIIKACRLQNIPLFIHQTPDTFNAQLEYIKYARHHGDVAVCMQHLQLLKQRPLSASESLKVNLQLIKINIQYQLEHSNTILNQYKALIHPNEPVIYKKLGDYCNQLYTETPSDALGTDIIKYYSHYLATHTDDLLTMIPRIVTLFMRISITKQMVTEFLSICELNKYNNILPHVVLITSFLMTTNSEFYNLIVGLINGLLKYHYKRIGWYILQSCYSTNPNRSKLMHSILKSFCKKLKIGSWMNVQVSTCQYLITFSEMQFDKDVSEISLSKEYKRLTKMTHLDVYVPLKHVLNINMDNATILKFGDSVTLLNSLVRPKKMKIYASDGLVYYFLLKKDEDLRKDERYLEIASFVNRRCMKLKATKQRQLHLRTYNVIVLNELNGLIEWMNHTETLRKIIQSQLRLKRIKPSISKIKQRLELPDKEQEFIKICKEIPPTLHYYFCALFSNPQLYFNSRMAFARTAAAMSIVGYALGLGDRHCENLLIDVQTGELVHVDFNCLFEKGKKLSIPEVVPFRLTQNIVRVFGITGYEGPFRHACELTLELLRKQYYLIDNLLDSFLNDPLMEWQTKKQNISAKELAQLKLDQVKNRVFGKGKQGIPLSVKGTVHCAIIEATSAKNLSQMYLGWMPYF